MRGLYLMFALLSLRAAAQGPIETIEPDYSDEARLAGLEGTVQVSVTIAEDGTPGNPEIARSLGLGLDEKALEAVKRGHFTPHTHKPLILNIPVDFLLPDKQSRWHLTSVTFELPEGASRPVFVSANYPLRVEFAKYPLAPLLTPFPCSRQITNQGTNCAGHTGSVLINDNRARGS